MAALDVIIRITVFIAQFTQWEYRLPRVVLSIIELERIGQIKKKKTVAFFSRMSSSICSHNNWRILWFFESFPVLLEANHFYSSMKWSSRVHNEFFVFFSLSLFRSSYKRWKNCSRDSIWRTVESQNTDLERCTRLCRFQADVLVFSSMLAVHSIDHSSNGGAFGFRWFWDPVWMTPSVGINFSFSERTCSRDDEVSLGIGSCHSTEISVIASVVHYSMECESK